MLEEKLKIQPPVYFFTSLIVILVIGYYFPVARLIYYPFTILGLAILIAGFIFGGTAILAFRKNKTTLDPNGKSNKLVISGVYKISRNPIYSGMFLMLFGIAVYIGSLSSIFVPFIFLVLIDSIIIPFEEQVLEKTFGKQYLQYKAKVRSWF